jgi:hypothetical protein
VRQSFELTNVRVTVTATVADLAAAFVDLDDDTQAQFFVAVAARMAAWTAHERNIQLLRIGRHLRDCSCSSPEARLMVLELARGIEDPT